MYIRDLRLSDIETNAPIKLREVNATEVQIENFVKDRIKPIREILKETNALIENTQSDANLSEHGKGQHIDKIKKSALGKISKISTETLQKYDSYIDLLSKKLTDFVQNGTSDNVVEYFRQRDIREALFKIKNEDIFKIYMDANKTGDKTLIAAIEENPLNSIKPILSPSQIEEGRTLRISLQNPDTVAEIALVKMMSTISKDLSKRAEEALSVS